MLENTPYLLAMEDKYPIGGPRKNGRVCFSTNPQGAYVYIDGIITTSITGEGMRTPFCVDIVEGKRRIVYRSEGYPDHADTVQVFPGRTVNKYANLESKRGQAVTPLALAGIYTLARMLI